MRKGWGSEGRVSVPGAVGIQGRTQGPNDGLITLSDAGLVLWLSGRGHRPQTSNSRNAFGMCFTAKYISNYVALIIVTEKMNAPGQSQWTQKMNVQIERDLRLQKPGGGQAESTTDFLPCKTMVNFRYGM